jgi:hypothetical protein
MDMDSIHISHSIHFDLVSIKSLCKILETEISPPPLLTLRFQLSSLLVFNCEVDLRLIPILSLRYSDQGLGQS